jgi:hypothetical protein
MRGQVNSCELSFRFPKPDETRSIGSRPFPLQGRADGAARNFWADARPVVYSPRKLTSDCHVAFATAGTRWEGRAARHVWADARPGRPGRPPEDQRGSGRGRETEGAAGDDGQPAGPVLAVQATRGGRSLCLKERLGCLLSDVIYGGQKTAVGL